MEYFDINKLDIQLKETKLLHDYSKLKTCSVKRFLKEKKKITQPVNKRYWYKPIDERRRIKKQKRVEVKVARGAYSDKIGMVSAKHSVYMNDLKKKITKAERKFGDYLFEKNIRFIFQKGFFVPFHRIVDFYLPKESLIIEIDGGYHKEIVEKDAEKDRRWLEERSMSTIRITNEEVFDGTFVEKIKHLL